MSRETVLRGADAPLVLEILSQEVMTGCSDQELVDEAVNRGLFRRVGVDGLHDGRYALTKKGKRIREGAVEGRAWNTKYPVGTPCRFWPGVRDGEGRPSKTRSEAWVMLNGMAVVMVEGYAGGIALSHVEATKK